MKKIEIEVLETKELKINTIKIINQLKNQYWKHEDDEHMRWFRENMRPDDLHILMGGGYNLLAYLNIVHVDVTINQEPYRMLGIGNVCVSSEERQSGVGAILMSSANALIKSMNSCGLLLCHDDVKGFYLKSGWEFCKPKKTLINDRVFDDYVLNYDPVNIMPTYIDELKTDRNF